MRFERDKLIGSRQPNHEKIAHLLMDVGDYKICVYCTNFSKCQIPINKHEQCVTINNLVKLYKQILEIK